MDKPTRLAFFAFGCILALLMILSIYGYTTGAWIGPAWGGDYWTNCEEAYRFCEQRGYHRDCAIWTAYGKPLSINRSYYPPVIPNPNTGSPFCKENPWHMRCGTVSEVPPMVREHTVCPIPEKYHPRADGNMQWALPPN